MSEYFKHGEAEPLVCVQCQDELWGRPWVIFSWPFRVGDGVSSSSQHESPLDAGGIGTVDWEPDPLPDGPALHLDCLKDYVEALL